MILTTSRIVCVNKDKSSKFRAFDLPIALTSKEDLKQPIFGANYICGDCQPLVQGSLPGTVHFKLWFMEGGCGTFVPSYLKMVASTRKNKKVDSRIVNALQNGTYSSMAYVDPNDPSVIYLEQPAVQSGGYNPFGGNGTQVGGQTVSQPQQYQPMPNYQPQPQQYAPQNYQPVQQNYQPMPQQNYQPMPQQNYQPNQYQPAPQVANNYPQQGVNVLNNVNMNNQPQQDNAKYFGFWGPELKNNHQQ